MRLDLDILFTLSKQQDLYQALLEADVEVNYVCHHSTYGHDAFLVETDAFGQYLQNFIGSAEAQK